MSLLDDSQLGMNFANLRINQLSTAATRQFDKFTSSVSTSVGTGYYGATAWHFEMRRASNINLPTYNQSSRPKSGWMELSTSQSIYHDNGKGLPESKFVNSNGREAVYDGNTRNLITDPKYAGTYNYVVPAPPPKSPVDVFGWWNFAYKGVGHVILDVAPFKLGGGNKRGSD